MSSLRVYAGAKTVDPNQGVAVLFTRSAADLSDRTLRSGGLFLTSDKLGALRLTAAEGTGLSLVAASGTRFVFDVASRELSAR